MANQGPFLGEFEVIVILAVLQLGDDAFGSAIRDEIERRAARPVSRGAVYITLDRLEEKSLLRSTLASASEARGGRPKRFFSVTPAGMQATKQSLRTLARMRDGLALVLGDL